VFCNRDAINELASRIERAYRRRHPRWSGPSSTSGIWVLAALKLLEASGACQEAPTDPELFVAVLASGGNSPNPWIELTQQSSRTRYISAVLSIVKRLGRELKRELRLADRLLLASQEVETVLNDQTIPISSLTRYIVAFRAGRTDLVIAFRQAARNQHDSCPLYRLASRPFLPDDAYPCLNSDPGTFVGQNMLQFSLN